MKPTYEELEELSNEYALQIEELERERNELAAQVERLRCALNQCVHVVEDTNYGWDGDCGVINKVCCIADGVLDEPPTASLAALKAQWQAEAFEIAAKLCEGESEENKPYEFAQDFSLMGEVCAETIRRYAQEAGDE